MTWWYAGVALTAVVGASVAQGPAPNPPDVEPTILLVARPELADTNYRRTVLLVLPVGNERHIGFIINRSTRQPLSTFFPRYDPAKKVIDPVYVGGPTESRALFAIVRCASDPGGGSLRLLDGLFVATHADVVDHIIAKSPNDARYYLGYVMWQPGELRSELFRRLWFIMNPDIATIFRSDTQNLWEEFVRLTMSPRSLRGRARALL